MVWTEILKILRNVFGVIKFHSKWFLVKKCRRERTLRTVPELSPLVYFLEPRSFVDLTGTGAIKMVKVKYDFLFAFESLFTILL